MSAHYRGLTWDHPRGYNALHAASALYPVVDWDKQSLEGFESAPIAELCEKYDLIILDHPHLGEAIAHDCLRPLDDIFTVESLTHFARDSIGPSYESYTMGGRQWALPLDAATQVMTLRPDLMSGDIPTTWDQVLALSEKTGKVAMSLAGPHAFLSLLSIAAALDPSVSLRDGDCWHTREVVIQACALLSELAYRSPACVATRNPIGILDHMTIRDDVVLCPLVYGYVNYANPPTGRALDFHNAPVAKAGTPGSILGGTGIAISRRCTVTSELRDYLLWLMSSEAQIRFIPAHDGQPSNRASWTDKGVNDSWNSFYSRTVGTLESASIRPRHNGYIALQGQASSLLREQIAQNSTASSMADALEQLFHANYPKT